VPENVLYYGDNLDILRRYIADDLVKTDHLDPPVAASVSQDLMSTRTTAITVEAT
jgi:hypothetical protein